MKNDFLAALEINPRDHDTRMVYADWLEEQNEWDESARQRMMVDSIEWIYQLCDEYGDKSGHYYNDVNYYPVFTYEKLMEDLDESFRDDGIDLYIHCGANEHFQDQINSHREELLKHWSIITGRTLDDEWSLYAGCAC